MKKSNQEKPAKKPKTKLEWALYRAKLNCRCGRDALTGKTGQIDGVLALEYALFCMFHALEEIALAMEESNEK